MSLALIVMLFFSFLLLAALVVGTVAVVRGTIKKSNWGINFGRVRCPRCGTAQPLVRKPANVRQATWGGTTCPGCGLELDKWGRPVPAG